MYDEQDEIEDAIADALSTPSGEWRIAEPPLAMDIVQDRLRALGVKLNIGAMREVHHDKDVGVSIYAIPLQHSRSTEPCSPDTFNPGCLSMCRHLWPIECDCPKDCAADPPAR